MTDLEVIDAGKACDAAEDEEDIASKFSGLERVVESSEAGDDQLRIRRSNDDNEENSSVSSNTSVRRLSTQVVRLPSESDDQH